MVWCLVDAFYLRFSVFAVLLVGLSVGWLVGWFACFRVVVFPKTQIIYETTPDQLVIYIHCSLPAIC